METRYQPLDSLRGIAALTVVFSHLSNIGICHQMSWGELIWWYAGHQAVILFFVLSGFVLSLPYHSGRPLPYHLFVSRRWIRIWCPYATVVILTFVWRSCSQENSVIAMPLVHYWDSPLTGRLLCSYLFLIGNIDTDALVPPAWTLVHEMRISLLFPIIFWAFSRLPWSVGIFLAILLSIGANEFSTLFGGHDWVASYGPFKTIHYAAMFIVGILLARHKQELVLWVQSLSRISLAGLCLVIFTLYLYPFYNPWSPSQRMMGDLVTMFGSAGLIILALATRRVVLGHRGPVFLGKISYSLYLVHVPLMLAMANSLFKRISLVTLDFILFGAVLVGAVVFWYTIERPALNLSRAVGRLRAS